MANIKINLLPPELEEQKKKKSRQLMVATISVGFLVVIIAFAAVVLIFRFSQSVILGQVQKDLESAKNLVSSPKLKQKEGVLTSLKTRLDNINSLMQLPSYSSYAYSLVNSLIPTDAKLDALTISPKGDVKISVDSDNIDSLTALFNNLTDPEKGQNKISGVTVDSLSRINNINYQADLTIKLVVSAVTNTPPSVPPPTNVSPN